ncbi:MAG TPA: FprA family A-type flavoprotein [Candidatus Limiplasma sp.]|nr:FprA family A-type flavoprotein [Candidatus Limiplasma sp.]
MHCARKITDDLYYVGASDRRLNKFENLYPIPTGIAYNSYLIKDEKTVLLDTSDHAVSELFFENLHAALGDRALDYLIVQHMEPDHASQIFSLLQLHPDVKIICSAKAKAMIGQFFGAIDAEIITVGNGDTLPIGSRVLTFLTAPMVHWPEVIMTYDTKTQTLFSADAFGTFGALGGNLYADEVNFEIDWLPEARRYYANIVGKYGTQVQALFKKAEALTISRICSLHGPVWRNHLDWYMDKYNKWSSWTPEDPEDILVVYGSLYGHTKNAAEALASRLSDSGARVKIMDASNVDGSELLAETFRCGKLVIACPTYNMGLYPPISHYLQTMKEHNVQNRRVAIIESGSWAIQSGKLIKAHLESMKDMTLVDPVLTVLSAIKEEQCGTLDALAQAIAGGNMQ